MDVTCERCGTEYLFDETLVSERGTAVKCTNCGHLFKVYRPGSGPEAQRPWLIRRRDGGSERLDSLRDLQKRIEAGALSRDDLISRGDDDWKRLGDIAELASFFDAATAAARHARREKQNTGAGIGPPGPAPYAPSPSSRPPATEDARGYAPTMLDQPMPTSAQQRGQTVMGVGTKPEEAAPVRPVPSTRPPPEPERGATIRGVGIGTPAAPADETMRDPPPGMRGPTRRGYSDPAPAPPPPRQIPKTAYIPAEDLPPPPPPGHAAATTPTRRGRGFDAQARMQTAPAPRIDDDDHIESDALPQRRGSKAPWIMLVLVVLLGGGGVAAWRFAPQLGLVHEEDPTVAFVTRGDAALARDDDESYDAAQLEYTKALAFRDRDSHVLTQLARAHAVWAQSLAFDANDLEARATTDAALHGEANRVLQEARSHGGLSLRFAEDAVRQAPADPDAEVAVADAMRLTGDIVSARAHYDRARALRRDATAEDLRVGSLLAMSEAGGNVAAARELAQGAVGRDGTMIRARLVLARAELAGGDVSGARVQIDAVLARDARHPRALALRDAIERGLPPAAPVVAVPDAGALAATALDAGVDLGLAAVDLGGVPANVAAGGGGHEGGGGTAPSGHDYDWYVEHGDNLLERDHVAEARSYYQAAMQQRPDGREAVTGMGYIAMNEGDFSGAVSRFRGPASGNYGDALIGMGEAYRNMQRQEDALHAYQRYLEVLPSGPRAAMARHWVDVLRDSGAGGGGGGGGGGNPPGGGEPGGGNPPPGGGEQGGHEAPPTGGHELPAPNGTTTPGPQSDTPAIGTER